jgi:hypothetical protein
MLWSFRSVLSGTWADSKGGRMKFINTDGLSLLGPGSEWFWTALSGVVLATTFLAIYRQLRLQASASAREQLNAITEEWGSERMLRKRLTVYQALKEGTPVFPDSFVSDTWDFWESVGTLARQGHLNMRVMSTVLAASVTGWWTLTGSECLRLRAESSAFDLYEDFEWLAAKLGRLDSGVVDWHQRGVTPERVQSSITYVQSLIDLEESLRAVRPAS